MADLGTVGVSASPGVGTDYVNVPLGVLGRTNYTAADAEPLPFTPTVPLTEMVGAVPI